MPDLPLPKLTPADPENRLSHEARQRIGRAFLEYSLIRKRALSAIDLGDYWNTPQEHAEMRKAALEAIRVVLRVEVEEHAKLGLAGREFREIIGGRIEGAFYSLGFSHIQRDMLEAEFLWPAHQEPNSGPATATKVLLHEPPTEPASEPAKLKLGRSLKSPEAAQRVEDYRLQRDWTYVEFGHQAQVSEDTIHNLVKTQQASQRIWSVLATVMGVDLSELLRKPR